MATPFKIPGAAYAVTRSINLRYFNVCFLVFGGIYLFFITAINVVAVGYENVARVMPTYQDPGQKLWYEYVLPHNAGLPDTRQCNGSVIKVLECFLSLAFFLIEALDTSNGIFPGYQFLYFNDPAKDLTYEGMLYTGKTFEHCSVRELDIFQSLYANVQDLVLFFVTLF
jgi:hypothetical protein